jgi:hypothetical protein
VKGLLGFLSLLAGLCLPGAARACAVCGLGLGANGSTFFWTTILLSLLPLAMIAAGVWYLRRQMLRHMPDEFVETDSL